MARNPRPTPTKSNPTSRKGGAASATASETVRVRATVTPTDEQIRRRAFELWERRGRQGGNPEEDWRQAERELRGES